MHVLVIAPFRAPFNAPHLGAFFRDHALAVRQHGCRVGIISPELRSMATILQGQWVNYRFQIERLDDGGIETWKCPGWRIPLLQKLSARLWRATAKRLAKAYCDVHGKPDLVHAHWGLHAGVSARDIANDLRIPYVVLEHFTGYARGEIRDWQLKQAKLAFRDADGLAAVSAPLARIVERLADSRSVDVIPNVVLPEDFPLATRVDRVAGNYRFLAVCHLEPQKGIDILLRAFAEQFRGNEKVVLDIAGAGSMRGALDVLSRDLGIAGQVRFLGRLSRSEVSASMQQADAFVLASRHETFGVVLIEAMATGLPVIATMSGGPEDFVDSSVGRLVHAEDTTALGFAMQEIWTNRNDWRARAPFIRDYAVRRFSPEVVGRQLMDFYARAIRTHGEGR